MDEYEEAVLFTFALLDQRLDRLEYLLAGRLAPAADERAPTIPDRIHRIEQALQQFAGATPLLDDVRALLTRHGDVLHPDARAHALAHAHDDADDDADDAPLDSSQKAALVVDRAPAFASTASQLKALDDQQLPSTDGFTELTKLRPRIAQVEARQMQQALKISELRRRSGLVVQRKKAVHLVGAGRCYNEWEKRLLKMYQTVAREEYRRRPEDYEGSESEDEGEGEVELEVGGVEGDGQ